MPRRIRRVTEEAQHLTDEERRGQRLAQFAVYAELIYLLPARLTMGAQVRTPGYPARQTLVVATFVLTVAVVAAARRSRPAAAWSLLVPLAAATYATGWPRPTWVAGTSALLAAAILLVARRPAAWIPMAAVVAADVGLTYAAGARHISELAYPLTATVDDSLLLFAVAALGAAVRRMHEARRDLAAAAAAAERLRAGTDLAAALTIPLAEVRDRFERALCLLGAAPDRSATEVAAAVRLVRLGLRGVRSVSEPPPDRRAPRRPDASRRPSSPRPSWSSCWRATASRPWPTSTTSGRPGPPALAGAALLVTAAAALHLWPRPGARPRAPHRAAGGRAAGRRRRRGTGRRRLAPAAGRRAGLRAIAAHRPRRRGAPRHR